MNETTVKHDWRVLEYGQDWCEHIWLFIAGEFVPMDEAGWGYMIRQCADCGRREARRESGPRPNRWWDLR